MIIVTPHLPDTTRLLTGTTEVLTNEPKMWTGSIRASIYFNPCFIVFQINYVTVCAIQLYFQLFR